MINMKCFQCGKSLKVPDAGAGKRGKCPGCGTVFVVPDPEDNQDPAAGGRRGNDPPAGEPPPPPPQSSGPPDPADEPGGELDGIEYGEQPDAQEFDAPATLDDKLANDFSRMLDVGHELQPELKRQQTTPFRAVSGATALIGLGALLLNTRVYRYVHALIPPYESLEELNQALGELGMVGAFAQLGTGIAAVLLIAGGLLGVAMRHPACKVMKAGLMLLALVQAGHAATGFIDAMDTYAGAQGEANISVAVAVVALSAGLLYYLKGAGNVVQQARIDEFGDIVPLVDRIFEKAHECRASDVHIEPSREGAVVRFRVDGVLHTAVTYPKRAMDRIVSRVKVMAGMDIAEKRVPQDGGTTMTLDGKPVDLRVSTVPSQLGERAVIRILDQDTDLLSLKSLGMDPRLMKKMHRIVQQPHGMFFCTGPTGSGKTTTLYAALMEINRGERNVMTVEDPVEYHLQGIAQLPISKRKGMKFSDGMRSILRQDPDVIMVGEVRDRETAQIAVQAAQTGHLVLSTLHTNDSAGAVSRLLDLQVEPYLLASTRTAVLAQRLVRRVCSDCRVPYEPDAEEIALLGLAPGTDLGILYKGQGCSTCMNTGYFGRIGIYELLVIEDKIQQLISKSADAGNIRKAAINAGMTSLRRDGVRKVMAGITTIEEVRRVTQDIRLG